MNVDLKDYRVGRIEIHDEPWTFQDWGPIALTFLELFALLIWAIFFK